MKSFLFGVGVGTAVGLLIAPQAGKKTRAEAHRILGWAQNVQLQQRGQDVSSETMHERTTEQEMTPGAEATAESEAVAEFLNTGKRDEFMEVPGIGRATAERIIKNRPYEPEPEVPEAEVLEKGVLSEATSEQVKEQFVDKDRDVA